MADNGQRQDTTANEFAQMLAEEAFADRIMALPAGHGLRRETTAQRDARLRGEKRFNAYGCK
jgi:hypothetical protein